MSSSSLLNVGRLERKFIRESADTTEGDKLSYNDPSFVTFRVLFDFEPYESSDEVTQGLLLSEDRDESGISYLRRMGEKERGESLKEFRWLLSRISNDFPWFFKSITGVDSLWKWGYPTRSSGYYISSSTIATSPVQLTLECNETIDFKITALADLYRKASWDRKYFRNLLTIEKRRFNMTILMGEARNLRSFVKGENSSYNTNWLNYVSALAFRCFDCEFDFSGTINGTYSSESYTQSTRQITINVNRVQEANSYMLLGYMLGEMKRDIIIKNGGSGASYNESRDIINYRSLLAPFIQSYENNYSAIQDDIQRLNINNLTPQLNFNIAEPSEKLSNREKQVYSSNQLDGLDESVKKSSLSQLIVDNIETNVGINRGDPKVIQFGIPYVEGDIPDSVDFDKATKEEQIQVNIGLQKPKKEDDMGSQIEFNRPKVETSLSDVQFVKPKVDAGQVSVELLKPSVDSGINNVDLTKPSVEVDIAAVNLVSPNVENGLGTINFQKPGLDKELASLSFGVPIIEDQIQNNVNFDTPIEMTEGDILKSVEFGLPSEYSDLSQEINFGKPKSEEDISSIKLQPAVEDKGIINSIEFGLPKVEVKLGS